MHRYQQYETEHHVLTTDLAVSTVQLPLDLHTVLPYHQRSSSWRILFHHAQRLMRYNWPIQNGKCSAVYLTRDLMQELITNTAKTAICHTDTNMSIPDAVAVDFDNARFQDECDRPSRL